MKFHSLNNIYMDSLAWSSFSKSGTINFYIFTGYEMTHFVYIYIYIPRIYIYHELIMHLTI